MLIGQAGDDILPSRPDVEIVDDSNSYVCSDCVSTCPYMPRSEKLEIGREECLIDFGNTVNAYGSLCFNCVW